MSQTTPLSQESSDHAHKHHQPGFIGRYIFSTDHKVIGIQYLFSSLLFLLVGGGLALLVRLQVGYPDQSIGILTRLIPGLASQIPSEWGGRMSPEFYTMLFTMHATVMIFLVIIPWLTGAFGNFLIPLMIGARDMAFPILNMLSYWFMWPAFGLLMASFFVDGGASGVGWTAYPTISSADLIDGSYNSPAARHAGLGQTLWLLAVFFSGVSSMMGSVNYITTVLHMRAPGMSLLRMPLTVWSLFITAILQAVALPALTVAALMQLSDKILGTVFFLPPGGAQFGAWSTGAGGGQPLLWQHLFWFYSHPAVYIMLLPAMGMVSDILAVFARKPLFGYRPMVYSMSAIAGLGFIVWGHHMFQSGMDPRLGAGFMLATIFIALPSAVKTFNWLATLWAANIRFTTAMLNAMAFVSMFVIGGLSGIFMAVTPVDVQIHDTYFIVAHIHYVLFLSTLFGLFAATQFWFPKMFGRMMSEPLGKLHFALTFILANCTFYPMHILGIGGHPRRYFDPTLYEFLQPFQSLNRFMTISAMLLGLAQLIFLANFIFSVFFGKKATQNPWESNTLEWQAPSPPPHGNFESIPVVYRGPYEYGGDGATDHTPQTASA
jgi:cytochrome c oxidase subunit 1